MLIQCPDCQSEVSDKAQACPRCACPIAPAPTVAVPPKIETVRTASKHKQKQEDGVWIALLGGVMFVVGCAARFNILLIGLAVVLMIVGMSKNYGGKYDAWKDNG
jgi:hypothetical protein